MQTVKSADGTPIAVEVSGSGPPLVMLAGAFCSRAATAPLAEALQDRFTVYNVDRRGRGDSGDTPRYTAETEVEDVAAVVEAAGGSAAVFGHSSGANLALNAAAAGVPITGLALYEPPFVVDGSRPLLAADLQQRLVDLVDSGRRGDAVDLYQMEAIGMPADVVAGMRNAPFRPALEQIAHTLVYDALAVGDLSLPAEELATVAVPVLVISGENSPPMLRSAAPAVAAAVAQGRSVELAGQTHDVVPEVTAPVVAEFLAGQ